MLLSSTVFVKIVAVLLDVPLFHNPAPIFNLVRDDVYHSLTHTSPAIPAVNARNRGSYPHKMGEFHIAAAVSGRSKDEFRILAEFKQVTSVTLVKASKDAAVSSPKVGALICKSHAWRSVLFNL